MWSGTNSGDGLSGYTYAQFTEGWSSGQRVYLGGKPYYVMSYSSAGAKLFSQFNTGSALPSNRSLAAQGYVNIIRDAYPASIYLLNMRTRLPSKSELGIYLTPTIEPGVYLETVQSQYSIGDRYFLSEQGCIVQHNCYIVNDWNYSQYELCVAVILEISSQ